MANMRRSTDYGRNTNDRATRRVNQRNIRNRKRKNSNKRMIFGLLAVVAVFTVVMLVNINSSRKQLEDLKEEQSKLQAEYDEQLKLSEELKEKEVYVHTNAYIEEEARKLGLVYPDETIIKPED